MGKSLIINCSLNRQAKIEELFKTIRKLHACTHRNVVFHLFCYAYLINVEGIFDELARVLYFFRMLEKGKIPSTQSLKKMKVWHVLRKITPRPVFLESWEEKKSIRNAIGHAEVYYDSSTNEAKFVDEPAGYEETLTFQEFAEKALELEDSILAFTYTMILLRLYD